MYVTIIKEKSREWRDMEGLEGGYLAGAVRRKWGNDGILFQLKTLKSEDEEGGVRYTLTGT